MSECGTVFKGDEDAKLIERINKLRRLAINNPNFNEGIAAQKKANELQAKLEASWREQERATLDETLAGIQRIANRYYAIADALADVINKCRKRGNIEGLQDMVAYAFNSQGIDPQFGGSGGLPVGKHPVTITKNEAKPTKDNQGGYIELTCTAFDGPNKGQSQAIRLNLHNKSGQAVEIANKQLAAICAVVGVYHFQDFDEINGKPFVIEVGPQKDSNFTEVVAVFDMNGNEPKNAGTGAMSGGNTGGNAGGGFPQGNQQGGGGFPDQQQNGNGQGGGNGGAWGNNGGNGQQQGGGDPNAGQGNGGGSGGGTGQAWGQNGGGGGNAGGNAGGASGWQQNGNGGNAGGGGGNPGWGQR